MSRLHLLILVVFGLVALSEARPFEFEGSTAALAEPDFAEARLFDADSGDEHDSLNSHRLFSRACAFNLAAATTLCNVASPGASPNIGSANGRNALVFTNGLPRLLRKNSSTAARERRWILPGANLPPPNGCTAYTAHFLASGKISIRCGSTEWLSFFVRDSAGRVPARVQINDNGVATFVSSTAVLLYSISGITGLAGPASNLIISRRTVTTSRTSTRTRTTTPKPAFVARKTTTQTRTQTRTATTRTATRTKTQTTSSRSATQTRTSTSAARTTTSISATATATTSISTTTTYVPFWETPTQPAGLVITQPGCDYVPVPYYLPYSNSSRSTVFNIDLVSCAADTTYDATFIAAAQRWMSIISADVADFSEGGNIIEDCSAFVNGTAMLACTEVDDLVIAYNVEYIDGVNKTLGSAGPYYIRDTAGLPFSGRMRFDSADWDVMAARGILLDVVLHEMGHVLGIGSLWSTMSLLTPPNCRTLVQSSQSVTGAKLTGAWSNYSLSLIDRTGSLSYVRVEDQWNQVGTTCSHWRENTFKQELMTGFVSISGSNPLSLLTAYSLMDLGYQIDPTSDAINKTYDVSTAIYDELPGKPADGFGLEGCLDDFKGVKTV